MVKSARSACNAATADGGKMAEPLAFKRIGKTILKLGSSEMGNRGGATRAVGEPVVETMQRLVAIVTKVRSPEGGWPSHLPPTPENLAPYVTEEAMEVFEALKQGEKQKQNSKKQQGQNKQSQARYILIEDLIPKLLWYVARSSQDIMRLLAGVQARSFDELGGSCPGVLRLACLLEMSAGDVCWSHDLVTQQPLRSPLTGDARIQLEDNFIGSGAIAAENLMQQWRQEILSASPEIRIFLEAMNVDFLEPGNLWQSGTIQLNFDIEWMATEENAEPIATFDEKTSTAQEAVKTRVIFAEPNFLEQYSQSLIKQHLSGVIADLSGERLNQSTAIASLVKAAYTLADILPAATLSELPAVLHMPLDELISKLLWRIVSSSYEVMQLVGGIQANVLQPEFVWSTGTLRLLASLKATAADLNWDLDLTTGEVSQSNRWALPANAIVQSHESRLLREPARSESLLTWLRKQTLKPTAELQLWMDGTYVDFLEGERDWHSVFLELSLDLEFMPRSGISNQDSAL